MAGAGHYLSQYFGCNIWNEYQIIKLLIDSYHLTDDRQQLLRADCVHLLKHSCQRFQTVSPLKVIPSSICSTKNLVVILVTPKIQIWIHGDSPKLLWWLVTVSSSDNAFLPSSAESRPRAEQGSTSVHGRIILKRRTCEVYFPLLFSSHSSTFFSGTSHWRFLSL